MDYHLKSLAPNISHILEDTRHFICRINEIDNFLDGAILVYFDVVGLYPNIPQEEGMETMPEYLKNCSEKSDCSTNGLCDLASIILKNNYFENGELTYHQKRVTAIGTKLTSPYSNLFMAGFQKRIFQNSEFKPFLWLRYFDDIFCIWTERVLNEFFNCIKQSSSDNHIYHGLFYNKN